MQSYLCFQGVFFSVVRFPFHSLSNYVVGVLGFQLVRQLIVWSKFTFVCGEMTAAGRSRSLWNALTMGAI